MKIAYLLGSLNRGGTETLLLDVFKNASKANFEFIGIHRKGGALQSDFYETKQNLFHLSPKFPFDIFYFYKLRKLLKKENVQIVHTQQYLDAFYAWVVTRFLDIKIIQTFHGFDHFDKKNRFISLISRLTNRNFYVSYFQKDYYTKKYKLNPAQQSVVYNGISFDKLNENDKIPDFFEKINSSQARLKMAMVGNFVRGREQNCVCRFLKLLHNRNIAFDFYFVGKKNEAEPWRYDDCVQYCKENGLNDYVHFLGSRNDVPAILKNIDAFVYSTDHDTFGIAVIEAIAVGIPVFVNDWNVMKEITNNGEWATIYRTKDEKNLFNKFLHFIENKEQFKENALMAAKQVRKKFSIEEHIKSLYKNYQLVLQSRC